MIGKVDEGQPLLTTQIIDIVIVIFTMSCYNDHFNGTHLYT